MRLPALLIPLAGGATLAACVPEDGFPSLAPRPGERDLSTEEPVRSRLEVPDDPRLRSRVAELRAQAAQGQASFATALPSVERAAANAGVPGSESWVAAQQALSRLEAERTSTTRALAELDRLAVEHADVPTSDSDFALIGDARAAVERIAAEQQQRLDRLRARLSGG